MVFDVHFALVLAVLAAGACALTWIGTRIAYPILYRLQIVDVPNERSSHSRVMIRGGGWAIGLVLLPLILLIAGLNGTMPAQSWLAAGFVLLFAVSAEDDVRAVTATGRILTQAIAVILGLHALPDGNVFAPLLGDLVPNWLEMAILALGWVWFVNLYNFMDGIDGITGAETISIAAALLVLLGLVPGLAGGTGLAMLCAALIGCAAGFLMWNWHPAKIFMGDVGSVPLGFVLGYALLFVAREGFLVAALIPPLYYLADATITLLKRLKRGETFWMAHREHFYQRAQAGLKRHDRIVWRIILCNIALIGCTALTFEIGAWALLPAVAAVALLCRHLAANADRDLL